MSPDFWPRIVAVLALGALSSVLVTLSDMSAGGLALAFAVVALVVALAMVLCVVLLLLAVRREAKR